MSWHDTEMCEVSSHTTPRARKEHKCCECAGSIKPGELYHRFSGLLDHTWDNFKWCNACDDLRQRIEAPLRWDEGIAIGYLYEAAEELGFVSFVKTR